MKILRQSVLTLLLIFTFFVVAAAAPASKGILSEEAYQMVQNDPTNTFIIDVRTMAEYKFVGHPDLPNGVPNIPLKFYPGMKMNGNFIADVQKRFDKNKILLLICRSGKRAKIAAMLLEDAGYTKSYYITDSFEGPKDASGLRTVSGWKNKNLPYTYKLDQNLVYR